MRKSILAILVLFILFGCGERSMKVKETEHGGELVENHGSFVNRKLYLYDFKYKGHIYTSCDVNEGISITHAGHCPCNNKKL